MNEHSSRAHTVFLLSIAQTSRDGETVLTSQVRLKRGVSGVR